MKNQPIKSPGRVFNDYASTALSAMKVEEFMPVYFPLLAEGLMHAPYNDFSIAWKREYFTPSIRATGITRGGSKVIVYGHMPNSLNDITLLDSLIQPRDVINHQQTPIPAPQEAFQQLVDADSLSDESGNRLVWVVDYETVKRHINTTPDSTKGYYPQHYKDENALEHPEAAAIFASHERAYRFLQNLKLAEKNLTIIYFDDFADEPRFRFINIDSKSAESKEHYVLTNYAINWKLHFVGLHLSLSSLSLDQILDQSPWFLERAEQDYNEEQKRRFGTGATIFI